MEIYARVHVVGQTANLQNHVAKEINAAKARSAVKEINAAKARSAVKEINAAKVRSVVKARSAAKQYPSKNNFNDYINHS